MNLFTVLVVLVAVICCNSPCFGRDIIKGRNEHLLFSQVVNANYGCTERGGICSNSVDCPTNGGEQEKLEVNCCKGKVCCKCTDTCPKGSSCIPSNATCDGGNGIVDPSLCCGDQVCCTTCVESNGCANSGGMCSDSSDCSTSGGEQEKLEVNCCQAKACCNCTDTCPAGSSCIPSNATCDGGNGKVDPSLCCGDQVCCTPCVENNGCTNRGGMCSDSSDCPTTGGEQEKLEVNCCQAKACCNCTDMCPEGSSCISSNATCDGGNGTVNASLCCGDQVCCTPCNASFMCKTYGAEGSYCQDTCNFEDTTQSQSCCGGQSCCAPNPVIILN